MQILRSLAALDGIPAGLVRSLLAQRFAELSQDEPYDPALHGFFVVVEAGDSLDDIERACGCKLLSKRYGPARFGDADFVPDWEFCEFHAADGSPGCFEAVFVLSDDGFGVVLVTPDVDDVNPALRTMCRTFALAEPEASKDRQTPELP